jgi:cytochrome c oxidase cbb3-type subunit 3
MAGKQVDNLTGIETTGHEWDGIRELNNPLPKWWLYVFYICIVWALIYSVFYPAWPSLSGYTRGLLGYNGREELNQQLADVQASRAVWYDRFGQQSIDDIAKDNELLQFAMAGGKTIFADNCAPCHGSGGAGRPAYPILVDDDWIWGGTPADIQQTIAYGIRNTHAKARLSEMPAFGADEILTAEEISLVADHVLSLSKAAPENAKGATIFAENCSSCHGELGQGVAELGGPNLADKIWLYGGRKDDIVRQIVKPRLGVMPPWTDRLDDVEIKQVAIYVHALGGGR